MDAFVVIIHDAFRLRSHGEVPYLLLGRSLSWYCALDKAVTSYVGVFSSRAPMTGSNASFGRRGPAH